MATAVIFTPIRGMSVAHFTPRSSYDLLIQEDEVFEREYATNMSTSSIVILRRNRFREISRKCTAKKTAATLQ